MCKLVQIAKLNQINRRQQEGRSPGSGRLIGVTPRSTRVAWQNRGMGAEGGTRWRELLSHKRQQNFISSLKVCLPITDTYELYTNQRIALVLCRDSIFLSDSLVSFCVSSLSRWTTFATSNSQFPELFKGILKSLNRRLLQNPRFYLFSGNHSTGHNWLPFLNL